MSGKKRTHGQRRGYTRPRKKSSGSAALWVIGVVAVFAALFVATSSAGAAHPDPRPNVGPQHVVAASTYAAYPRISRVYRHAARVTQVLDGLYCYCRCAEHSGHYSLLDCFNSDHAAHCDVCMSEAELAYQLHQDGKTLDQIRHAVDQMYGA